MLDRVLNTPLLKNLNQNYSETKELKHNWLNLEQLWKNCNAIDIEVKHTGFSSKFDYISV